MSAFDKFSQKVSSFSLRVETAVAKVASKAVRVLEDTPKESEQTDTRCCTYSICRVDPCGKQCIWSCAAWLDEEDEVHASIDPRGPVYVARYSEFAPEELRGKIAGEEQMHLPCFWFVITSEPPTSLV